MEDLHQLEETHCHFPSQSSLQVGESNLSHGHPPSGKQFGSLLEALTWIIYCKIIEIEKP